MKAYKESRDVSPVILNLSIRDEWSVSCPVHFTPE
jgi:hypothetical protein